MDINDQRRGECRYIRHDKLFVQLLTASKKVDAAKVTLLCHSCDASINGLKVEIEQALDIQHPIDLWLSFEGLEQKFYLRGHVCWCCASPETENLYQLGIELEDAHATDYAAWIELLKSFSE